MNARVAPGLTEGEGPFLVEVEAEELLPGTAFVLVAGAGAGLASGALSTADAGAADELSGLFFRITGVVGTELDASTPLPLADSLPLRPPRDRAVCCDAFGVLGPAELLSVVDVGAVATVGLDGAGSLSVADFAPVVSVLAASKRALL